MRRNAHCWQDVEFFSLLWDVKITPYVEITYVCQYVSDLILTSKIVRQVGAFTIISSSESEFRGNRTSAILLLMA